jgi:hypothetical protein
MIFFGNVIDFRRRLLSKEDISNLKQEMDNRKTFLINTPIQEDQKEVVRLFICELF